MKEIQKISSIILISVIGISVVLTVLFYFGGSVPETIGTSFEEKKFTSLIMIWGAFLLFVALIITLTFTIINIFTNSKVLKNFMIVLGLAAILFLISFLTASSDPLPVLRLDKMPSPLMLKWVGTGLNAAIILTCVAFLCIIISEALRGVRFLDR